MVRFKVFCRVCNQPWYFDEYKDALIQQLYHIQTNKTHIVTLEYDS